MFEHLNAKMPLAELALTVSKFLFTLFVLRCITVYSYRIFLHPLRSYQGPFLAKISDWYGAYHAVQRNLHLVTYEDHLRYGSVYRQGPNKLVFNSAEAVRDILQNERLPKSKAYLILQNEPNVYNLLSFQDKQLHRVRRRLVGQGLTEKSIHKFAPVMEEQIVIYLKRLVSAAEKDQVVDMSQQCNWLALDVSGELGFGKSFELQSNTKNRWMPPGISAMNWIINIYLQFPAIRKMGLEYFVLPIMAPGIFRFHRMVSDMIKQRLALDTHARPDLFASVSDYKDPDTGKRLSQEELWAESTLLIPAAGDTITSLMSASFFYLSRYPNVYQRLSNEIRTTFTEGVEIKHGSKLSGCRYLRAFFDETLRISPPGGTTLWRDIPNDSSSSPVIIDGHLIPPTTQVGVNVYAIHHNEAYFPSPFTFKPERWIPEESGLSSDETKKMHSAYIPFSRGSRNCPGMAMAFAEASLAIAKTLWYFDFEKHGSDLGSAEAGKPLIFRMEDQVGSRHTGPQLRFRHREDFWREL